MIRKNGFGMCWQDVVLEVWAVGMAVALFVLGLS